MLVIEQASGFKAINIEKTQVIIANKIFEEVSTPAISSLLNLNIIALCKQRDLYNSAALAYINFTWKSNFLSTFFICLINCSTTV